MKFFIQTVKNRITFDFSLELKNELDRHNYFYPSDIIEYILSDDYEDYKWGIDFKAWCPIGSVEFVSGWYKFFLGDEFIPKPINIPDSLNKYEFTQRHIHYEEVTTKMKERLRNKFVFTQFIKDTEKIKSEKNGLYKLGFNDVPEGKYLISSEIPQIDAEFRCFVFENKLLDIRQYDGDFKLSPNYNIINQMVEAYKVEAPISYTLDVGVNDKMGTFIIEVHDFFSCGLYGFMETKRLPFMFWRWNYNFINKIDYPKLIVKTTL